MHRRRLVPLLAVLACAPAVLRADWSILLPRTLENHAWIDIYALYEKDSLRNLPRTLVWSDLFFREKLTLETAGYFYHPRFLRYRIKVAGGLDQEQYENSTLPPVPTRNGNAFEYDARLFFLPEHPYNLELFATRTEPLFRQENAVEVPALSTSYGADFRYRKRPWFFHVRASDEGIDSGSYTTDIRRLALDGKYYRDLENGKIVSFDARFVPSRYSTSYGYYGNYTDAFFGNTLQSGPYSLLSNVTLTGLTQQGGTATLQTDSSLLSWYEQFTASLPWNLRLNLFWRYFDNSSETTYGVDLPKTTFKSLNRDAEAELKHQLYESLQSTYIFRWNSGSSTGGTTTTTANALMFSYAKRIPGARGLLSAGLNLGESAIENTGQNQVVEELHPGVPVPGAFLLQQQGGDAQSVVVLVRSPAPPYDLVRLTEGANYTVTTVGNSLEVTVFTLPPEFAVPGKYDVRVSYSLLAGNYDANTRVLGLNGSLALFDNLVTPYASYNVVRWTTVSGTAPGGGLNSNVLVVGISFFKGPLRGRVEYEDVTWSLSPWKGWKAEVQYVGPLGPSTNLNSTANYRERHYGESPVSGGLGPYTEKLTSVWGSVQQYLLSRNLSISGGGSYTRYQGLSNGDTYSLNATISFKAGKLEILGGANYTSNQSQTGTPYAGSSSHQYYYLWLRRLIF